MMLRRKTLLGNHGMSWYVHTDPSSIPPLPPQPGTRLRRYPDGTKPNLPLLFITALIFTCAIAMYKLRFQLPSDWTNCRILVARGHRITFLVSEWGSLPGSVARHGRLAHNQRALPNQAVTSPGQAWRQEYVS